MQSPREITRWRRTALSLAACGSFAAPPAVVAAGLAALALAAPLAAQAQASIAFDIPAGPLQGAMVQFVAKAGANLQYDQKLVAGKTTAGLRGSFAAGEALRRLLQGAGLEVARSADGDYVITAASAAPAPAPAAPARAPAPAPDARVDAATPAAPAPTQVPTITITGTRLAGLVARKSSSATNTDTPISEIPRGVLVVTEDQLQRQQVQSIAEALGKVSGFTVSEAFDGETKFRARGFSTTATVNGLASPIVSYPMAGVESVEVLKGADAVLQGIGTPGGTANLKLKKPQAEPVRQVVGEIGSRGHVLSSLDLAGRLLQDDERWTYRFVGSAEHDDKSAAGYKGKQQFYVAPTLGFSSGNTEATAGVEYNKSPRQPNGGFAVVNSSGEILAASRPPSNANDHGELEEKVLNTGLTQKLGGDWQLQGSLRLSNSSRKYGGWSFGGLVSSTDALFLPYWTDTQTSYRNGQLVLSGPAKTGPVDHQLSFGIGVTRSRTHRASTVGFFHEATVDYRRAGIDLPDVDSITPDPLEVSEPSHLFSTYRVFSFQDQLKYGRFTVLASLVRTLGNSGLVGQGDNKSADNSPNLGVVYGLNDEWNLYLGRQAGLTPVGTQLLTIDGKLLPSTTYKTVQGGLKYSRKDGQLSATLELYKNDTRNLAKYNFATGFYELVAGQTSQGFDVDVSGCLSPGWDVTASYAYGQSRQTDRTFGDQVPKHTVKLWTSYSLPGEALKGWSLSGGVQVRTAYNGFLTESVGFRVPGGASVDLGAAYKARHWSATFGVKNAFDRLLYDTFGSTAYVGVQSGRTVVLTGRYNF